MNIHFTGSIGGPFGWGVWGQEMCRALSRLGVLRDNPQGADVILTPILNNNFLPATALSAKVMLGVCFFEDPLPPKCALNASIYDTIFCGSAWNLRRMEAAGITNGEVLTQGVDSSVFSTARPRKSDGSIRIFSGGKFEYRKGQDLVIAAFREFLHEHPTAHLVCSWSNPWPQLVAHDVRRMFPTRHFNFRTQEELFEMLFELHGISRESFTILPPLTHKQLATAMWNTDFGVFPNRCEGGTNLVLMEYLSCGRRACANLATGHSDLGCEGITEIPCTIDEKEWAVQDIGAILNAMKSQVKTCKAPFQVPAWTWKKAARKVADTARNALLKRSSNAEAGGRKAPAALRYL
jgi:glycosyltransferase involved in cell wall biosynthesis